MVAMSKSNVQELRPRGPDSEKITINLGYVDLGQIDLLVTEGFYSNRTDFIRTARVAGEQLHVRVLGLLTIAPDVSAKLARATISSLTVLGALHASPEVKAALADRMRP
jgi:Arc/MetJ-type ribon-helix-helix transcriptional regulator